MKKSRRIIVLLLAALMALSLAACAEEEGMNEEEIKEACTKEVENFVGGYLSNSSTNYLKKYENDPEEELSRHKLRLRYDFYSNSEIAERVADHILENASFEVDPYSFYYNKKTEIAEIAVNVTIIPAESVRVRIEELLKNTYIADDDQDKADRVFQEALTMIGDITPVTASIPIKLALIDGQWMIQSHWMVMVHINEAQ